jgi:predicted transcriptional regulator
MTIRLESAVKQKLDRLSSATNRSKSFLAAEAIREYISTNEWQIQQIRAAVKEADAGEFADDAEVGAFMDKWNGPAD